MLSALALAVILSLVAVVTVAVVAARRTTAQPAPPRQPGPAAARARRHLGVVTALAWTALVGVAVVGWQSRSGLGPFTAPQLTGLVPLTAGAAFLLVMVVGELTWPQPSGSVRRALLVRRSARDLLGRALPAWTATLSVALVVALVAAGLTADHDGRSVSRTDPHARFLVDGRVTQGEVAVTSGPYPGWYYGLSLLVATALLGALTVVVLRMVTGQPAVADTPEIDDLALRRTSVRRVLAGVQAVLGVTLGGVLCVAGAALHGLSVDTLVGHPGITTSRVLHTGGTTALVLGAAVAVASLVVAAVVVASSRVTFSRGPAPDAAVDA